MIDASAMVELLLVTDIGGQLSERIYTASSCHAPHLLDVEVAQVVRRFVASDQLKVQRGREALADLSVFPLRRHAHIVLLDRVFELRGNLSAYDAVYVALAEALGATLITCDGALAQAPRIRAEVELFQ